MPMVIHAAAAVVEVVGVADGEYGRVDGRSGRVEGDQLRRCDGTVLGTRHAAHFARLLLLLQLMPQDDLL